jgi:hypothetical protein
MASLLLSWQSVILTKNAMGKITMPHTFPLSPTSTYLVPLGTKYQLVDNILEVAMCWPCGKKPPARSISKWEGISQTWLERVANIHLVQDRAQ